MATCKLGEKGCWKDGKCHYSHNCENKVLTNAERIRAMSDEELADFIFEAPAVPCDEKMSAMMKENNCNDCKPCIMEWLKRPAKEGRSDGR